MVVSNPTSRRAVLQLVIIGTCFAGLDTRMLLAQAAREGKPLLTQENANKMLGQYPAGKERSQMMEEIAQDPIGFLKRNFAVTDQQMKEIESIPAKRVAEVAGVIRHAARTGHWVTLSVSKDGCDHIEEWHWDPTLSADESTDGVRIYYNSCGSRLDPSSRENQERLYWENMHPHG